MAPFKLGASGENSRRFNNNLVFFHGCKETLNSEKNSLFINRVIPNLSFPLRYIDFFLSV